MTKVHFQDPKKSAEVEKDTFGVKKVGKTIMVCIDNSEDSEYAVNWTVQNMYQPGDRLHLLHCIPFVPPNAIFATPDGGFVAVPTDRANVEQKWCDKAEDMVRTRFKKVLTEHKVDYELDLMREAGEGLNGGVGDRICELASKLNADAVIMASHRLGKLSEFLLGSVTQYCISRCEQPMVVLHSSTKYPDPSVQRATKANTETGRKIIVSVDNSSTSEEALKWCIKNVYQQGDTFHLLHVVPAVPVGQTTDVETEGLWEFTFKPEMDLTKEYEDVKAHASQHFINHLNEANVPFELDIITEYVVDSKDAIGQEICTMADELEADAVVLAGHSRRGALTDFFMGSVSNHVTHHCKHPVIIYH
jgi:nucleotide-binding universal stress UspA family protein